MADASNLVTANQFIHKPIRVAEELLPTANREIEDVVDHDVVGLTGGIALIALPLNQVMPVFIGRDARRSLRWNCGRSHGIGRSEATQFGLITQIALRGIGLTVTG